MTEGLQPQQPPLPPLPPPPQRFSWGQWIGGVAAAFALGSFGNAFVIMIGFQINKTIVSAILGLLPGIVLIIIGKRMTSRGFGGGLLVGGCLIALLGGICGAIGTATQERSSALRPAGERKMQSSRAYAFSTLRLPAPQLTARRNPLAKL